MSIKTILNYGMIGGLLLFLALHGHYVFHHVAKHYDAYFHKKEAIIGDNMLICSKSGCWEEPLRGKWAITFIDSKTGKEIVCKVDEEKFNSLEIGDHVYSIYVQNVKSKKGYQCEIKASIDKVK